MAAINVWSRKVAVATFWVSAASIGAILTYGVLSPQSCRLSYILNCYWFPFRTLNEHRGPYLQWPKNYTGEWRDYGVNGNLEQDIKLKDGRVEQLLAYEGGNLIEYRAHVTSGEFCSLGLDTLSDYRGDYTHFVFFRQGTVVANYFSREGTSEPWLGWRIESAAGVIGKYFDGVLLRE